MIKSIIKKLFPEKAKKLLKDKLGVPSQESSLRRIREFGFSPKYCLDIGAYTGTGL